MQFNNENLLCIYIMKEFEDKIEIHKIKVVLYQLLEVALKKMAHNHVYKSEQ